MLICFIFSFFVIMGLSYRIAKSKARSGWWGLLGILHMAGLLFALYLPRKRNIRRTKNTSDTSVNPDAEPLQKDQVNTSDKPHAMQRGRKRTIKRETNNLSYLFKLLLTLIAYMWITIGSIGFIIYLYFGLADVPLKFNGTAVTHPAFKLLVIFFPLIFIALGLLYLRKVVYPEEPNAN